MIRAVLIVLLLGVAPAAAQEPTPFRWTTHEEIPSRISDALVAAQFTADLVAASREADRWRAIGREACRTGFVLGVTEVVKRAVRRTRPNHADHFSFPSAHTAHAVAHADYAPPWGASIAVAVAWGRQAGGWHYGTDVAAGAAVGWLSTRICR